MAGLAEAGAVGARPYRGTGILPVRPTGVPPVVQGRDGPATCRPAGRRIGRDAHATLIATRLIWVLCLFVLALALPAWAGPLDEMSLDRWAKLREVERYQMQIAERYYKQQNWKAALAEYEKYVTLYEKSEGSSYAQLKWGLCQVQLRKANTAIKDGFQTVIDYWPDSADAILARYHIGRTFLDMGHLDQAKAAYQAMLKEHGKHPMAAYVLSDLVDIAQVQKDVQARSECWKKLTFDVQRVEGVESICRQAAKQYGQWCFWEEAFEEGVKALATSYAAADLPGRVTTSVCTVLGRLADDEQARSKAQRLGTQAARWLMQQAPTDVAAPAQKELLRKVLFQVADVRSAAGQEAQVAAVYDEIFKRCGVTDPALARLAEWHESRGRFDEACKAYRRFEKKVDGLAQVAGVYRRRKLYPAAIATYKEILSLPDAVQARWTAEIAATHREARQYAEAIAVYRELMKIDPTNTPQWLWLTGTAHRDAGQWKQAIGVLRQCTNFPDNLQVMAYCHRRLKEYNEALLLYNQIGSDERYAPWAALEIASTWEEADKKEQAIKAFQQVCKRFPKSSQASAAHTRLQSVYKINMTLGGSTDE